MISCSLTKMTKHLYLSQFDETDKTKHQYILQTAKKIIIKKMVEDILAKVHQLCVKEINLAKTHSIQQAKLFLHNQSLHNVLHGQIH